MSPPPRRPSAPDPHQLQRPDLAAQMVMDILQQRKESETERKAVVASQRTGGRDWRPWLMVLVPLFLGLTAWNLLGAAGTPAVFGATELEASLRFKVYLAAQAVQAFRDSAGHLPGSLAEVRWHDPAIAYVRSDTTYAVVASANGVHLTYHHGESLAAFTGTLPRLLRGAP